MGGVWLTEGYLSLKHLRQDSKSSQTKGAKQRTSTRRAMLVRLRKLEVKARLDGSVENLTDEQLFSAFPDLVERAVELTSSPCLSM